MGKEENLPIQNHSDFNYATFREQAIASMLSGDKELTSKDGRFGGPIKPVTRCIPRKEVRSSKSFSTARQSPAR